MIKHVHTAVAVGFNYQSTIIRGTVINKKEFKVGEGLGQDTVNASTKVCRCIIHRHTNGNRRHTCTSLYA